MDSGPPSVYHPAMDDPTQGDPARGRGDAPPLTLLIASFLEALQAERIRTAHPDLRVMYRPDLIAPSRYPGDHSGGPFNRTPEQEAEWRGLLAQADILFDFDRTHKDDLPTVAPRVRWIQSTSSGIGPFVKRLGYAERMPHTVITRASGVHAQPLAEFCLMVMLMHTRRHDLMAQQQAERRWERFAGSDLQRRTVVVVGLGGVGAEVARMSAALGLRVVGVGRTPDGARYRDLPLERYVPVESLEEVLPEAEFLVLIVPHTSATEGLMGRDRLRALPRGAVLINIGRGDLVDEDALVEVLRSGHLGGAGLDVFREEPLPESSPLWELPNVLVSPHSASTSHRENERITDLFLDNLARFRAGEPLRNVLEPE